MNRNRRDFIKDTGAICALAVTGRLPTSTLQPKPPSPDSRGMARGLTVLSIRSGSECRLGVKSEKGILDVV